MIAEPGFIAVILYLLALVPVCIKARLSSRSATASDHYLAGRSLGFLVLILTLYATSFSGNTLLGHTAQAYQKGFFWTSSVGIWMATLIGFHLVVPKLRAVATQQSFVTPGDWVRFRFSGQFGQNGLRMLCAIVFCLALCNFLFAQLKAAGEIMEVMTNGRIPYSYGVLVFALVILLYDSLGGLRAVAWTDAIQGIIMLFGFCCLVNWLLQTSGGMESIFSTVSSQRPASVPPPNQEALTKWFCILVMGGLAVSVYPQTWQRVYAAKDSRRLSQSMACMGFIALFCSIVVLLTGWAAVSAIQLQPGQPADQVMPMLLQQWSQQGVWHEIAALTVMMAVLAAIMSTADSVLLSLISMLRHDIKNQSNREGLKFDGLLATVIMCLLAGLALYRDITLWHLMELKFELLVQCVPAFILCLHWNRPRAVDCLVGVVAGLLALVIFMLLGVKQFGGVSSGFIAMLINFVAVGCSVSSSCFIRQEEELIS